MNVTTAVVLPLLIGVIAGLRAMTAPAAISLAARAGRLDLSTTSLAFLGYGVVRGSREARLASAALVVLAVVKVFLYDLTGITGLWRALSVICLGAVLIGIGLVYQKLIFARRPARP